MVLDWRRDMQRSLQGQYQDKRQEAPADHPPEPLPLSCPSRHSARLPLKAALSRQFGRVARDGAAG